jgi:hypothetical protein
MRDMTDEVLAEGQRLFDENKRLKKQNLKLQQRLNRITNLMIGNERIWVLDRLAMELDVEAEYVRDKYANELSALDAERVRQLEADALFLRRLEWDLGELHVAIRGDTNRRGDRYDQANWKGVRP